MKRKVLVVDDEKPIVDILQFKVYYAYDGNEAISMVEEVQPNIILLDIMMPFRDGMEVCREVRKKYEMPIIMLTAKDWKLIKCLVLNWGWMTMLQSLLAQGS